VRAFAEGRLDDFIAERGHALSEEVRVAAKEYILNVNVDEYAQHLQSRYEIDVPVILASEISVESREEVIPAERFPPGFFVLEGKSYPRPVLRYHVPVTGEIDLLRYVPNPHLMWAWEFGVEQGALTFDVTVRSDDPAQAKAQAESIIRPLVDQTAHSAAQLRKFNENLEKRARDAIEGRRQELQRRSEFMAGLGVPIRKRDDLPKTFAVLDRGEAIGVQNAPARDIPGRLDLPRATRDRGSRSARASGRPTRSRTHDLTGPPPRACYKPDRGR
jgi:hypothetical protein